MCSKENTAKGIETRQAVYYNLSSGSQQKYNYWICFAVASEAGCKRKAHLRLHPMNIPRVQQDLQHCHSRCCTLQLNLEVAQSFL